MRTILSIVGIIIGLILLKVFFFAAPNQGNEKGSNATSDKSKAATPPLPVNIFIAKSEKIDNAIFSTGTVMPNEQVDMKAEASGRLIKLHINEGMVVKKGQLIAKIKDNDLQAQLQKLNFNEQLANQVEARQKKLLAINAISTEEYEMALNATKTIGADKELIKSQIEKTLILAPFTGKIGLKNISEGAYLSPGTTVASLLQLNPVKIDFTVPEKYAPNIRIGSFIKLGIDGNDATYTAKIIAIDPQIDVNLRTLKVRALAQNANGRLIPGMFVEVQAALAGKDQAIMIPTQAIVSVLRGKKIFILKNGVATETIVETGLRTDKKIQILKGLHVGDSLIVSGIMALKADAKVKAKQIVSE